MSGNPYEMPDDMKQAVLKYNSDESAQIMSVLKLPYGVTCQTQTRFFDCKQEQLMNVIVFSKEFRDSSINVNYQAA